MRHPVTVPQLAKMLGWSMWRTRATISALEKALGRTIRSSLHGSHHVDLDELGECGLEFERACTTGGRLKSTAARVAALVRANPDIRLMGVTRALGDTSFQAVNHHLKRIRAELGLDGTTPFERHWRATVLPMLEANPCVSLAEVEAALGRNMTISKSSLKSRLSRWRARRKKT